MFIENAVSVKKANNDEVKIRVRSVANEISGVVHENFEVQECENEGEYYIGLATEYRGIQIKIEDVPMVVNAIRQAYEKQVVNEHLSKWGNK